MSVQALLAVFLIPLSFMAEVDYCRQTPAYLTPDHNAPTGCVQKFIHTIIVSGFVWNHITLSQSSQESQIILIPLKC